MKSLKFFVGLFIFIACATSAYANPPRSIDIKYDQATKTVAAIINHPVINPEKHYIKKVDIGLNGKEIKELTFQRQETRASQTITYVIPEAKAGDVISVEGYCSLIGKSEEKLKI